MSNDNYPLCLPALRQQLDEATAKGCDGLICLESPAKDRTGEDPAIPTVGVERFHPTTINMLQWGFPLHELERACCINAVGRKPPASRTLSAEDAIAAEIRLALAMQVLGPQLCWVAILGRYAEHGSRQFWPGLHKIGRNGIITAGFMHPTAKLYILSESLRDGFKRTASELFTAANDKREKGGRERAS